MRKIIILMLTAVMCLSLVACGGGNTETSNAEQDVTSEQPTAAPEEITPEYAELISNELQGVWCEISSTGQFFTAFKDNNVEHYSLDFGVGAENLGSSTYVVESGKVSYNFYRFPVEYNYAYENDVLVMYNGDVKKQKLSAADIMEYLIQEESVANLKGVICLSDLIINNYPDSAESSVAAEKKDAAISAIKSAGEEALSKMRTVYDKVVNRTWYLHKDRPEYLDTCCFIYPYFVISEDGENLLVVELNYTDAKTNAGWVFFDQVIFSVDGENTTKHFNYNDVQRDNDDDVYEKVIFAPTSTEIELLKSIANSTETIIRFQGDKYVDHIVTDKEKAAIIDVLTAYDYFVNYSE